MKKFLLLFVAVATLVFVGCSKDDEKEGNRASIILEDLIWIC